jgi:hypothetical protein
MNLQDKLEELREFDYTFADGDTTFSSSNYQALFIHYQVLIDALEIAVSALQFECGNRCAEQNPCNAKDAIQQIKIKLGCV